MRLRGRSRHPPSRRRRAFAEERPNLTPDTLPAWLEPLRQRWNDAVPWSGLAWFAEGKARLGAYATLLGLRVAVAGGARRAQHARGARPWEALEALDDDGAFAAWVSAGHAEGSLHNDDATVIRVRVGASP